jgi:hypothetical protein
MIAMEDITVQKKGFVTIITADNMEGGETNLSFWKNSVKQMVRLHQGLPGSLHGTHVVIKNLNTVAGLMFSYVIQMTAHALNPLLKIRMRIHKGECGAFVYCVGIIYVVKNTSSLPRVLS